MKLRTWKMIGAMAVAGLSALGLQASASAAGAAMTSTPPPRAAAAAALPFLASDESVFHTIRPFRILDTRSGLGGHLGKISSGAPLNLQVTGPDGPILPGTSAIAFNVTVVGPTASSYLTIWPAGFPQPTISTINYVTGQTVANYGTVGLSAAGKITIKPGAGSTHVLIDIAGFYAKSVAWGQSGYFGWVKASDGAITFQYHNNILPITITNNGPGTNTVTFPNVNITAFFAANASIQVSALGEPAVCTTSSGMTGDDLDVFVTCRRLSDGLPANTQFYLQVSG